MTSRPSRKHWCRNRAWALVAALLPATECWAAGGQDVPIFGPETTASSKRESGPGTTGSSSNRASLPPPRRFHPDEIRAQSGPVNQARPTIPPPRRFEIVPVGQPSPPVAAPAPRRTQDALPPFGPASDTRGPARYVSRPASSAEADSAEASAAVPSPTADPVPIGPVAQAQARPLLDVAPMSAQAAGAPRSEPSPPGPAAEPSAGHQDVVNAPPVARAESPAPAPAGPSEPANGAPTPDSKTEEAPTLADLLAPDAETPARISGVPQSGGQGGMGVSAARQAGLSRALQILGTPSGPSRAVEPVAAGPRMAQAAPVPAVVGQPEAAPAAEPKANSDREGTQDFVSGWLSSGNSVPMAAPIRDVLVERTECATCGGFHSSLDGPLLHGCLTCGGGPNCVPGQKPCNPPSQECETTIGAFCQSLYQCLCCPDPCYQPAWVPAANASFFADYARPRTVTRLRYDNLEVMTRPDRNQFWIKGSRRLRKNGRPITEPLSPGSSSSTSTRRRRASAAASSSSIPTGRSIRAGHRPRPASAT